MANDGRERGERVHCHLGLGGRYAAQKSRLPCVGVAHQPHVGDCAQLEKIISTLSALPRKFLEILGLRGGGQENTKIFK